MVLSMNNEKKNKKILVIVGPTAVGKTEYALQAAKALNGEIVSADSMQLYKYMDIGSAKPTKEQRQQVVHHLVDQIEPSEEFSVATYQKLAKEAIEAILARGKLPILSGGTGLYVNSIIYKMDFSQTKKISHRRAELEREAKEYGPQYLHDQLAKLDPPAAERIHANNVKKVIRALEILENHEGSALKTFEQSFVKNLDYDFEIVGLNRERKELYERIDRRVDILMDNGLVEEVRSLLAMGLTEENISMKGIGYKEIIGFLNQEYEQERAVYLIKLNSRHYAKRQLTWFRRYDPIRWFDISSHYDEKNAEIYEDKALEEFLKWL